MNRERWMALCFTLGSLCFAVAPLGIFERWVGGTADTATYFAGSIPFTIGGALQTAMAWGDRRSAAVGFPLLRAALAQSIGTVFFNITTFRALYHVPSGRHYDMLVWRPDAIGSTAFLVSGVLVYRASPRHGWRPANTGPGWWEAGVNLLGCVLFAISALGALVISGVLVGPRLDSWGTGLGAVCFLLCALPTVAGAATFKSARLRRWEDDLRTDLDEVLAVG